MNEVLTIRFRRHKYSIKTSKSDGRISLGFDDWLLGEFWSSDAVISHIEEQARWADDLIRAPKLPKGSVERIENFIRTQPFMLGSES